MQDSLSNKKKRDIDLNFEYSYFTSFTSDLENREKEDSQAVHVINIDIQDNHEEATIGAFMICDLCTMVSLH